LERKLTVILCADVFGYSRLMGENEEATLRTLSSHRKLTNHHKNVQIHLTTREGSVSRHFEYWISTLGGINHEKAFAGQKTLALATRVVPVLVFLMS